MQNRCDFDGLVFGAGVKLFANGIGAVASARFDGGEEWPGELGPQGRETLADGVGRLSVGSGGKYLGGLGDVPAFQAAFLDDAASGDQLFVEAVAVAGHHRESGMGEHGGRAQGGARDGANGDAVDLLPVRGRPDFGTKETEATLHQSVVEVGQHDVVATSSRFGVEGDGPLQMRVRMFQTAQARLPGGVGEVRHSEGVWDAFERGGDEARLAGQGEGDMHYGLDVGGSEVEIAAGFVKLLGVAAGEFADVLFEAEQAFDRLVLALGAGGVQAAALAEHGFFHLLGNDGADFAQIFADLLDLLGGAVEKLQVGGEGGTGAFCEFGILAKTGGYEVVDVHFGCMLTVSVDAAVALFQAVGVPGDLVVDKAVAVALEVDAFAGGVGGKQDADRRVLGIKLEGGLDALAVIGVLRAVEEFQTVALLETAGGQVVMEPLLGVAVFGEDDDAFLVPLTVGPNHAFQPFH